MSSTDVLSIPTVAEAVVNSLRGAIVAGEFSPGERLIEEQIAERFGVSRPPVREALRLLTVDGLVESVPRKGFSVIRMTSKDVRDMYDFRFALERSAIELGVPVRDVSRLVPLYDAVETMRTRAAQRDPEVMLAANTSFHTALVALAGNRPLSEAYERLSLQLSVCMAMNLKFREQMYNDPKDAVTRHEALLGLIEEGSARAVLKELAAHGDRSFMNQLDALFAAEPETP